MSENGRKNKFRVKQTTKKVLLMFLDVRVLTEREHLHYWILSTKNQVTVYVLSV